MARLNDGPITADTFDAARRRFLRQNRELARINSSHSMRIHNLETEKSRLLSENLALHEENIQLRVELEEKKEHSSQAETNVVDFQRRLDEQIHALQELATSLNISQKVPSKVQQEQSSSPPAVRDWRDDVPRRSSQGDEWRLPTIMEDKYYPRRTLNADEIQSVLFDQNTDSPDLGPPPVVNFDLEDPVKFEAESEQTTVAPYDEGFLVTDISTNLETRKRRRDGVRLEVHKTSDSEKPVEKGTEADSDETRQAALLIKNGAKRKHHERDNPVTDPFAKVNEDGFCFSRKTERLLEQSCGQQDKPKKEPDLLSKSNRLTSSSRRVLGDKSVNTDPVTSPKKDRSQKPLPVEDKQKPKSLPRNRLNARKSQVHKEADMPSQPEPAKVPQDNDMHTAKLNPKILDPTALTSPSISKASTLGQKSHDTPPPTDLHPAINLGPDSSMEQARPSRRARASVNYAEPNLNRKMRRPTGAMVDAIGREERRLSGAEAAVPVKMEQTDEDINTVDAISPIIGMETESNEDHENAKVPEVKKRTVFIKTEGNPRFDWRSLPIASPTQHSPGPHDSLERKADGTRSSEDNIGGLENRSQSAASSVISTLTASGRQPSRKRSSLIRNATESTIIAERKELHDRQARRSSSSSNVSDASSRSIYDMQSSPSAGTPDHVESVGIDASEHGSAANDAGSLRAKRLSGVKTRRVSVGAGNITAANSVRRDRARDMNAARASGKGFGSDRHGSGDNAEDRNGSLKEDQTKGTDNTSDLKSKCRTAPRRRSMLL